MSVELLDRANQIRLDSYRMQIKGQMRDGDGDGRCRERGGKFVPCPPGTPVGKPGSGRGARALAVAERLAKPKPKPSSDRPDAPEAVRDAAEATKPIESVDELSARIDAEIQQRRKIAAERAEAISARAWQLRSKEQVDAAKAWVPQAAEEVDFDDFFTDWIRDNPEPDPDEFANDADFEDSMVQWRQAMIADYEAANDGVAAQREALTKIFDGPIVGKDGKTYQSKVSGVYSHFGGLEMGGRFLNDKGETIGTYTRTFYPYGGIHHDYLQIDEPYRDAGIASAFNARNEGFYRLMGYDQIDVEGASNLNGFIGATHWPRNGYDWRDDLEREVFLELIQSAVDEFDQQYDEDPSTLPAVRDRMNHQQVLFHSQQERNLVLAMLEMAQDQDFEDPERLSAGDLLHWPGAEVWFQRNQANINYTRKI